MVVSADHFGEAIGKFADAVDAFEIISPNTQLDKEEQQRISVGNERQNREHP